MLLIVIFERDCCNDDFVCRLVFVFVLVNVVVVARGRDSKVSDVYCVYAVYSPKKPFLCRLLVPGSKIKWEIDFQGSVRVYLFGPSRWYCPVVSTVLRVPGY
jgi:hypothetical protein